MSIPDWVDTTTVNEMYTIVSIINCSKCWRTVQREDAIRYRKGENHRFACFDHEFDQEVLLD